jgi:hypothetical protein
MDQSMFQDSAAAPALRAQLNDLRTLFEVIASGRHMLGDRIDDVQCAQIIDAIGDATLRGAHVTTKLLASS